MKVYIDVIFFLNFSFDFLLLITVKLLLKRRTKLYRIFIASLFGALTTFLLFIRVSSITLFLFKIIVSILMILISFGKKSLLRNTSYLYFTSIILGGFLYFLNMQFSYKNEGLIFFYNGFSINIIVLLFTSPIILYYYYRQSRYFNTTLTHIHEVELIKGSDHYFYRAYYDTGNKLVDPYKKRSVTLLYDPKLSKNFEKFIPIPYQTLASTGIVHGIIFDKMIIDSTSTFEKVLIGFTHQPFHLEDASMILPDNFISTQPE